MIRLVSFMFLFVLGQVLAESSLLTFVVAENDDVCYHEYIPVGVECVIRYRVCLFAFNLSQPSKRFKIRLLSQLSYSAN